MRYILVEVIVFSNFNTSVGIGKNTLEVVYKLSWGSIQKKIGPDVFGLKVDGFDLLLIIFILRLPLLFGTLVALDINWELCLSSGGCEGWLLIDVVALVEIRVSGCALNPGLRFIPTPWLLPGYECTSVFVTVWKSWIFIFLEFIFLEYAIK